jgi:hypothetical protein
MVPLGNENLRRIVKRQSKTFQASQEVALLARGVMLRSSIP